MVDTARKQPLLTKEQEDDLFMLVVEDDTEEAPWMAVGDAQFWSASSLAHSLRIYAHEQGLPWYVASMLPITYTWPGVSRKKTVAPDVLVSFVPERVRASYDVAEEGVFPAFVLEVVSPSSVTRDMVEKYRIYNALGAQEYVLFTPEGNEPPLQGYRRGASGELEPCPLDANGRLHSAVLDLDLVVDGLTLQAMTRDGRLLLTPEQTEAARRQAEEAQRRAEEERQRAEGEVARLRAELERYRAGGSPE